MEIVGDYECWGENADRVHPRCTSIALHTPPVEGVPVPNLSLQPKNVLRTRGLRCDKLDGDDTRMFCKKNVNDEGLAPHLEIQEKPNGRSVSASNLDDTMIVDCKTNDGDPTSITSSNDRTDFQCDGGHNFPKLNEPGAHWGYPSLEMGFNNRTEKNEYHMDFVRGNSISGWRCWAQAPELIYCKMGTDDTRKENGAKNQACTGVKEGMCLGIVNRTKAEQTITAYCHHLNEKGDNAPGYWGRKDDKKEKIPTWYCMHGHR